MDCLAFVLDLAFDGFLDCADKDALGRVRFGREDLTTNDIHETIHLRKKSFVLSSFSKWIGPSEEVGSARNKMHALADGSFTRNDTIVHPKDSLFDCEGISFVQNSFVVW